MRPNRRGYEDNSRYRLRSTRSDKSDGNVGRIVTALVVAIGIVVVAVFLANTYDFKSVAQLSDAPLITGTGTSSGKSASGSPSNSSSSDNVSSDARTGQPAASSGDGSDRGGQASTDTGSNGGETGLLSGAVANISETGRSDEETSVTAADPNACVLHGRVTDDWGSPMAGVMIRAITADGNTIDLLTDSRGRYSLPESMVEVASVSVVLSNGLNTESSFAVMKGEQIVSLTAPSLVIETAASQSDHGHCEINFDTWNVEEDMLASPVDIDMWPDAASAYQYIRNAEALAIELDADLEDATTLQVQLWCTDPELGCDGAQTGAFFVAENELEPGSPPIIAMTPARTSAMSPGIPDNREYHEYGHYFLSLQTGDNYELPAGDTNHGGYYNNSSTQDSFVEGFAEFYSMMVSRQIDGDDRAELYTMGADYDLEMDRLPWEANGWWEEFTVAGLLLDLVDSTSDYAQRAVGPSGVAISEITTDAEPSGTIVQGKIINGSPIVVRDANVTVRYMNEAGEVVGTQVTTVLPDVVAPTREGTFFAAPPQGLGVTAATATIGGVAKSDDDQVSLELSQLVKIITEYERPNSPESTLGVANVAQLYDALTSEDRNSAIDSVSVSDIDDIFVNHGFFADLDGDKAYNPEFDGPIGESSHPVLQVAGETFPAIIPRQDPDGFEGSFVTIDTGGASVDAIIQISMPGTGSDSYAYVTPLGESSQVEMAVPPSDLDAEVTIITAGKSYKPVIAFRVGADDFHERVEAGVLDELQVVPVELESGATLTAPTTETNAIQFGIILGGIVAVMLVVVSLIVIQRQWGKA